jgi:hypothetical protein
MRSDGYVRAMLTVIALALGALVAIEGGWLGGKGAAAGETSRWQMYPLRYGPLGNFLVRFDSATGKLERVRFPANDVVWEEIGVLPPAKAAIKDSLRPGAPAPVPPPEPAPAAPAPAPPTGGGAP